MARARVTLLVPSRAAGNPDLAAGPSRPLGDDVRRVGWGLSDTTTPAGSRRGVFHLSDPSAEAEEEEEEEEEED